MLAYTYNRRAFATYGALRCIDGDDYMADDRPGESCWSVTWSPRAGGYSNLQLHPGPVIDAPDITDRRRRALQVQARILGAYRAGRNRILREVGQCSGLAAVLDGLKSAFRASVRDLWRRWYGGELAAELELVASRRRLEAGIQTALAIS